MRDTRVHPETGATLLRDVRQQTVRFGSLSQIVEVSGWYPEDTGDAIHTGADLKQANEAFKALRMQYAARIRAVRKTLKLTQEQAGVIIGGGKRAFQKYESGRIEPSDAAVGLIEVLARHPEAVATLRGLRSTAVDFKPVEAKSGPVKRGAGPRIRARRTTNAVA